MLLAAAGVALALGGSVRLEAAALLPAQQDRVSAVDASLQKAADLYRKHKLDELGKLVDNIQKAVGELKEGEGHEQLAPQIEQLELRLASAQKLLKYGLESVAADTEKPAAGKKKLAGKPAARKPGVKPKPIAMAKANPTGNPATMAGRKAAGGGISFSSQIGPLLQGKCGRCHGNNPKGGFSVASYADIRKGSDSGFVFFPGKGQGSRLIELLDTGEMPKGGNKLSPDEIGLITQWIDQGAPFDADPVSMLAAGGSIAMATGNETVSFMDDIAPVLVGKCTRCHGGERGADNMELDTFTRLMKGGRTGAIVMAGSPTSSLIVQMIEGTARDKVGPRRRMPDRSPPLAKDIIEKIKTWIAEGAKFDGGDPNASLEFLVRVRQAAKATHEELSKIRDQEAKRNWALGNPGLPPIVIEEDAFRLVGDLPSVRMKEV
ncbi:MAG TPA: c-type cytochrome domain-containing protein, partial [Pirellulales bacterium]